MERVSSLGLDRAAVDAEQVGPLQGPEVGIFGSFQQPVDQPLTLVGANVGKECSDFFRRGQDAE
jgi:hypothetical protein